MQISRLNWAALFCGAVIAACTVDPPAGTDSAASEVGSPAAHVRMAPRDAVLNEVQGNCGGDLTAEPVDLAWSELLSFADARVARDTSLFLRAENTSEQPVSVVLTAEVNRRGVTRTIDLGSIALAAGESRRIGLRPETLGIERAHTRLAGHVSIRGAVRDAKEATIMTVFAPGRSFHFEEGEDALAFYDDETRDQKYGKGDPFGVISAELRDDPNVLSITDHDEAAQNAAGENR